MTCTLITVFFCFTCSEGLWKIYFTKCNEGSSEAFEESWGNISKLVMIFYGTNGKSEPISLDSRRGDQAKNHITYDVNERIHSNLFLIIAKCFSLG